MFSGMNRFFNKKFIILFFLLFLPSISLPVDKNTAAEIERLIEKYRP